MMRSAGWLFLACSLPVPFSVQQLMGKHFSLIEQKKLRAFLQTSDALLLIGSATTVFNALHDYSHPFYHFFHIRRLGDLSFEDMKTLILGILAQKQRPELSQKALEGDARLKALYSFTGGNPRMAIFLADILSAEVPEEMLELMDRILDELTPYFLSMLAGIPDYLKDIINTLAAFEPAQSPMEISKHLEVPQTSIRNYLKLLKEDGYVRVAFSKGKSNYYCLNEYPYRLWFQMRDLPHREETRWLMEFLLMVHSRETINDGNRGLNAFYVEEQKKISYKELSEQTASFTEDKPGYGNSSDRDIDSYINYIETLESVKEKETEVMNFFFDLFIMQIQFNIEAENVRKVLKRMEEAEGVPFSDAIFNVWTCLSDPDSVEAQRHLNEKAIAEIVKELKEKAKPQE